MASVVAGGLFNAVAFAGAGCLFSKLNHRGYADEIKRHNHAFEQLAKAKQEWYEKEVTGSLGRLGSLGLLDVLAYLLA